MIAEANPKTWEDQPDIVANAKRLCGFPLRDGWSAEVRKIDAANSSTDKDVYFVTFGTLFGSQTIRCATSDDVFLVLATAEKKKGSKEAKLPKGSAPGAIELLQL